VFSLLDSGGCGGVDSCQLAVWTRLDDSAGASQIFCNWDLNTNVFAAGVVRYSGVDINNPIIGLECETGVGSVATAPSIITQKGSEVIWIVSLLRYNLIPKVNAQAENVLFEATSSSGTQKSSCSPPHQRSKSRTYRRRRIPAGYQFRQLESLHDRAQSGSDKYTDPVRVGVRHITAALQNSAAVWALEKGGEGLIISANSSCKSAPGECTTYRCHNGY
jgi:hypothetical protein